jgi:hypothetical protein
MSYFGVTLHYVRARVVIKCKIVSWVRKAIYALKLWFEFGRKKSR